ncbi:MAG: L,D-transpeptidase family protein [Armatimonadota bacterium]
MLLALLCMTVGCETQRRTQQTEETQTALEQGLAKLPVSIGENTVTTVQEGETWVDVGVRERVGFEHLRRANRGDISTARKLNIPGRHQVPSLTRDGIVVNLPELIDYRLEDGKVVDWYPITIGRSEQWATPLGSLRVTTREKDPVWDRPDWAGGGRMPPGPDNPLGDRWIGLNKPGYGLHGTNDPTSIGRFASAGCIRHYPQHIHELFDRVSIGTPVVITYQTVTVGVDDSIVYMSVFPDIYGRGTNSAGSARKRLQSFRLDGALTDNELQERLSDTDGIARLLLGSKTKVTVNLLALDSPIGTTVKGGTSYLPVGPLADALDAQVTTESETITLSRGDREITLSKADNGFFTALDTRFVPIARTVKALGGNVEFEEGSINITINPLTQ